MTDIKKNREGFSLIEMIIAIAIVAIVMSGVILLISYSTNTMRRTTNTVDLQNEVKDAMLHITTHIQEGSEASWVTDSDGNNAFVVAKCTKDVTGKTIALDVGHYWLRPAESGEEESGVSGIDEDKGVMFIKDVVSFTCDVRDNRYVKTESEESVSSEEGELSGDGSDESSSGEEGELTGEGEGETTGEESGAPTEGESETGEDLPRYVLCYCQRHYENVEAGGSITDIVSSYLKSDGKVNFDALKLRYNDVTSDDDINVTESFSGTSTEETGTTEETGSTETSMTETDPDPTPTPVIVNAGGSYVHVTIELKNRTQDAKFTSEKDIYLRNQ